MTESERTQRELIEEAVNSRVWAVVGASEDMSKWGSRIYRALKQSGYTGYPVNPEAATADGDPTYPTLLDLPEKPDVVDVVVPRSMGHARSTLRATLRVAPAAPSSRSACGGLSLLVPRPVRQLSVGASRAASSRPDQDPSPFGRCAAEAVLVRSSPAAAPGP